MLNVEIYGLKCDMPLCGWKDMSITFEEYSKYVNAQCPKCGANILTEGAHKRAVKTMQIAARINSAVKFLQRFGMFKKEREAISLKAVHGIDGEFKRWTKDKK